MDRRSLTKGQKAMVVARACVETKQTVRDIAKQTGAARVGHARTVLTHAPDLAEHVRDGNLALDAAAPGFHADAVRRATEVRETAKRRAELPRRPRPYPGS